MGNTVGGDQSLVLDLSILKCHLDVSVEMLICRWLYDSGVEERVLGWMWKCKWSSKDRWHIKLWDRKRSPGAWEEGKRNFKDYQLVHSSHKRSQRWRETSKRDWEGENWQKRSHESQEYFIPIWQNRERAKVGVYVLEERIITLPGLVDIQATVTIRFF